MLVIRGLGALPATTMTTPVNVPSGTITADDSMCPPPDGFTWVTTPTGHWERLKAGQTPQWAPKTPGMPCGQVEVRDTRSPTSNQDSDGLLARYQAYWNESNARVLALTDALRGIITTRAPSGSIINGCHFWQRSRAWDILTPPGVIVVYGVPFSVEELQNGQLSKTVIPTPEQRFLIDWAVYTKSQAIVASLVLGRACGKNVDVQMDHVWGYYNDQQPTNLVVKAFGERDSNPSIRQIMAACDAADGEGLTYYVDGYSLNPIAPTQDELYNDGGLRKYYMRGGFLIDQGLLLSKIKLDTTGTYGLRWNVGYYLCPDANIVYPSTNAEFSNEMFVNGGTPIPAAQYHSGEGKGWNIWLHGGRDGHYTISVTPTDPGTGQKILKGITAVMDKIWEAICFFAPASQPIMQDQLLKEICVDPNGKSCKKGTANCKCTQPTTAQKDAVAVASSVLAYACGKRAAVTASQPTTPPQQLPVPPGAVDETAWKPPWWLIAISGFAAGAAAFAWKR